MKLNRRNIKIKLDSIINDLVSFLEKDYSSRFKDLTMKEDRQLFFLAKIVVKLKHISLKMNNEENVLPFPKMRNSLL